MVRVFATKSGVGVLLMVRRSYWGRIQISFVWCFMDKG